MKRCSLEKVGPSSLVIVNQIKVSSMFQQRLNNSSFGWLVAGCCMERSISIIVPSVNWSATLEEKVYGGHGGEVADWIASHRGSVSGASKVERSGASPTLGPHADKLVHSLLHVIHLILL
jgi:hypothetical protein